MIFNPNITTLSDIIRKIRAIHIKIISYFSMATKQKSINPLNYLGFIQENQLLLQLKKNTKRVGF